MKQPDEIKKLLTCPWCGEQMRFDGDSVHVWYKCDNCLAISPKARRLWDDSKTNQVNWIENKNRALFLIERSNAKSSRWIPVEERLPPVAGIYGSGYEYSEDLIVYDGLRRRVAYYCHTTELWVDSRYEDDTFEVTHWMPLPEPPKEEPHEENPNTL